MAVTQNTYTGDGSTVLFSFTFPYLETTDVKVSVNGATTTAYSFANATAIEFDSPPANGAQIRIFRVTDDSSLPATFYPGSSIRSQDLNSNFQQTLYRLQETNNYALQDTGNATFTGTYTFANPVTVAAPTSNGHAVTKAYVDSLSFSSTGIPDGNKGDVTLSGNGTTWTVNNGAITPAKLSQSYLTTADAANYLTTSAAASTYLTQVNASSSYLQRAGGSMTGDIVFSSTQAFPKVPANAQVTSYTLLSSDAGKHISITTGGVTVPSGIFAVGELVSIFNNSGSNQTITQGAGVTLRFAGTANTGNRTLAGYGICTLLCVASNVFVISGAGLS